MQLTEAETEIARRDFEVSLLFPREELARQLPHYAGCIQRSEDGFYKDHYIESAWRGFVMAQESARGQVERFDSLRYISNGMVTHFKEVSQFDWPEHTDEQIHDAIRATLTICGETPV